MQTAVQAAVRAIAVSSHTEQVKRGVVAAPLLTHAGADGARGGLLSGPPGWLMLMMLSPTLELHVEPFPPAYNGFVNRSWGFRHAYGG